MFEQYWQQIKDHHWYTYAVLGSLFFFYILIIQIVPLYREIQNTRRTIQNNQQRVTQTQDYQISYDRLLENNKRIQNQIEQLVFSQKQDAQLSTTIEFLSRSAKAKGIDLSSIKPQEAIQTKQRIEFPIELSMTTQFHRLGRFINTLETSEPVIQIKALKIRAQSMTSTLLNGEMTLIVYYLGKTI